MKQFCLNDVSIRRATLTINTFALLLTFLTTTLLLAAMPLTDDALAAP
jgi:hypothetical protein